LAAALSQQLQLEENNNTNGMTGTTKKGSNAMSSSNKNEASSNASNFLLGGDSIYSSYLKNISALDGDQSNSTFSTSMFDNLLGNSRTTATTTTTHNNNASNKINNTPIAKKVVLDSDVSDSDEDSQNDSEDDNSQLLNSDGNQRMTKGVRPIMERRAQDNRLLVQRKIDNWANRVDPEANRVESNESMINRMKDRHRNQVKLAALRQQQQDQQQQQQQQQQQYNMMPHHMVTQPYGSAAIPLSPNVVLPHPGMLMDPAQMYYSAPLNDYPETPGSIPTQTQAQLTPLVPLPAGFLPNPTHATLAIPHKEKEKEEKEEKDQHAAVVERQSMAQPPVATQSYSTPTNLGRPKSSRSPPAMPLNSATMPSSVNSSFSSSNFNLNTQTLEPSPASSSITLQSTPSSLPTDIDGDNIADDKSVIVESPIQENMEPIIEDEAVAEEADAESSDDEERRSVILRKKKSMKKLRQKQQQQQQQETPSVGDTSNSHQSHQNSRQIRSSKSAPNLKKKQSSKKAGKSTSRSSSRRNSQETCTPPSEFITTPPPLPINHEEEHHYHLPRSYSHHQMHQPQPPLPQHHHHHHHQQQQQNGQHQHQPLRRMKSEPDLPRTSQYLPAQQQLNNEWDRMQIHQREQQLKKHYYQGNNNSLPMVSPSHQQQPRPYMPMYSSPVYYNAMPPPMMPYSGSNGMEAYSSQQDVAHRASMMSSYNKMVYQQQSSQGYYHPSNR
jgi:hypothetical protein